MTIGKLLAAGLAFTAYQILKEDKAESAGSVSLTERAPTKKAVYSSLIRKGQIRLLKQVFRLIKNDTPKTNWCLETVQLNDKPAYDALSYAWSSSPEDHTIDIDGHNFPLTEDLDSFLTRYNDVSTAPIWIDAICIQQAEPGEKAEQVSQMTQVYEGARRVIIWLGGSSENSRKAFELLDSFGSPSTNESYSRAVTRSFQSRQDIDKWLALADLLTRRWWTRAWIFQEVIAAKKVEVWCGLDNCSWENFAVLVEIIEDNVDLFYRHADNEVSVKLIANHHHVLNLALYQRQHKTHCPPSLSEALQTRRRAKATDPRDKVYCLLGICREEQDLPRDLRGGMILNGQTERPSGPDLKISYDASHTVAAVYKGVARHIITKCRHLEILSACQNPSRNMNIPSWTPDWSVPRRTNPIVSPDMWGRIYNASTESPPFKFEQGSNSNEIVLSGIHIGHVNTLGPIRSPTQPWDDIKTSWAGIAIECSMAHPDGTPLKPNEPHPNDGHSLYFSGQTIEDAFLRTCVMDRIAEFRVEPGIHLNPNAIVGDLSRRETFARNDATENRRFGKLNNGAMGLFPAETQLGDDVYIFAGADVPFVVHQKLLGFGDNVIVGECYVHGMMFGEVAGMLERERREGRRIDWSDVTLR